VPGEPGEGTRPRVIGTAWGDPRSVRTYSGVPAPLFAELERTGSLVATADADLTRRSDVLRGLVDWRRSFEARRPRRSAVWRYLPENIELLSRRFASVERSLPAHDAVLQFGVGGVPDDDVVLVSHVEIPVRTAVTTTVFARSYGFDRLADPVIERAIEGERWFLERSALVWTNTPWTAELLAAEGVEPDRLRVFPPACAGTDPGEVHRDWDGLRILFIGKDWERKGGPLLLEAFRLVLRSRPDATLTIVGCSPPVREPGVRVLGFLDRDRPADATVLHDEMAAATVFCMPSYWESTGLVYLEAALYGLPLVMLAGQGREHVFPSDMAIHLDQGSVDDLADALVDLGADGGRAAALGRAGRRRVLADHTLPAVAARVGSWLGEALDCRS
jgi:glycosyltransferase involved in cell wall biosynthesis